MLHIKIQKQKLMPRKKNQSQFTSHVIKIHAMRVCVRVLSSLLFGVCDNSRALFEFSTLADLFLFLAFYPFLFTLYFTLSLLECSVHVFYWQSSATAATAVLFFFITRVIIYFNSAEKKHMSGASFIIKWLCI